MKKFINLEINGEENSLISLLTELKKEKSKLFVLDKNKTEDYAINIFTDKSKVACFRTMLSKHHDSTIWLFISTNKLRVANILSSTISSLGVELYNSILLDFWDKFFKPLIDDEKYDIILTKEEVDLEELLEKEVYKSLNLWEITCNKTCPIGHPNDRERWFEFLKLSIEYKSIPSISDLQKWLIEDRGWHDEDSLMELMEDFEYGIDLLSYYTGLDDK